MDTIMESQGAVGMHGNRTLSLWESAIVFRRAFREVRTAAVEIQALAADLVRTPPGTPAGYAVGLDPLPPPLLTLRRNLFSTMFQSVYHLLEIEPGRRLLYGKLNYLFRVWVTGADNLLDGEDKLTLPVRMPGRSRVMRQVVSIMAADRVLTRLLRGAERQGLIGASEADLLSEESLRALLPSAAQEASEEGGITDRPSPEEVLGTIHRLKTGLLFHLPFLGPERLGRGPDFRKTAALKEALMTFAIGCQILDDIRDMARDHREKRHNYILSCLQWSRDPFAKTLDERRPEPGERIYLEAPHVVLPAAQLALRHLRDGLAGLSREGLALHEAAIGPLAGSMFAVLDLEDLSYA